MSISWLSDAEPRAAILVLPPGVDSLDEAHAAIELWEHYSRKTLDATQRLTVQVMMAESGGRWAARTTGREMPRQNGKGDEIEVVELWGLVQRGEAILHTAHELTTVSSAHQRMVALIEGHADLRRRVRKILNGIGQQLIELTNGAVAAYRTRTNGGGRGLDDISRLVIDEAQHAKPEQLASSTPILLANPNPQMNFAGTGAIEGVSDWWWEIRKRALSSDPGPFGYVGHTAESVRLEGDEIIQTPIDPTDRSMWPNANPALVAGRGEAEFFEEQLRTLGARLFGREHLGVWDPPPDSPGSGLIPTWESMLDPESRIGSHRVLALDVTPDAQSRRSSLSWVGRRDDARLHVETFDNRPGTGWLIEACQALKAKWGLPVVIQTGSPAAAQIERLREAGVEVDEVSPADHAKGLTVLLDAASEDQLRHLDSQVLAKAVRGALVRSNGDVDVLARRTSKVDISPLVSIVIALSRVPSLPKVDAWAFSG